MNLNNFLLKTLEVLRGVCAKINPDYANNLDHRPTVDAMWSVEGIHVGGGENVATITLTGWEDNRHITDQNYRRYVGYSTSIPLRYLSLSLIKDDSATKVEVAKLNFDSKKLFVKLVDNKLVFNDEMSKIAGDSGRFNIYMLTHPLKVINLEFSPLGQFEITNRECKEEVAVNIFKHISSNASSKEIEFKISFNGMDQNQAAVPYFSFSTSSLQVRNIEETPTLRETPNIGMVDTELQNTIRTIASKRKLEKKRNNL